MLLSILEKLTPQHIHIGKDQVAWIKTQRTKTYVTANVPLIPQAMELAFSTRNLIYIRQFYRSFPITERTAFAIELDTLQNVIKYRFY